MAFKKRKDHVEMTPLDVPRDITGQGPTDEALEYVALAYRFAYALGEAPTKGVMDRLKLTRSTAAKWVMAARERGYLGPTTPGAAGERD
jgi:hypothetical protein